jgi:hypothetical protein
MFTLDHAISEWRRQMLVAGIKSPVPLEELEIHLREETERQMKSGLNEQKAFEISVQRIGQPKMLDSEFNKIEKVIMNKIAKISAGIIIILGGVALSIPAATKLRTVDPIINAWVLSLVLGNALAFVGAVLIFCPFNHKKRKA